MINIQKRLTGTNFLSGPLKTIFITCSLVLAANSFLTAQDNSPYSRYGIGDIVPSTNVINRGMGKISAAYTDFLSINFSNPASYTGFQALKEARSNKLQSGRVIFDVGINYDSRTLQEPNNAAKFRAQNLLFSYLQVGVPLSSKTGFSFGLRPVSRISYKIQTREKLSIGDSVYTLYSGDGGSFLPNVGLAHRFGKLSIGINAGYLFGKKDYSTRRVFINDSIDYYSSNHQTKTVFGNMFLQGGLQYTDSLNNSTVLTIGATGNLATTLNANQDIIRETFTRDVSAGDLRIDSVYEQTGINGTMKYPSSFTVGFVPTFRYGQPRCDPSPGHLCHAKSCLPPPPLQLAHPPDGRFAPYGLPPPPVSRKCPFHLAQQMPRPRSSIEYVCTSVRSFWPPETRSFNLRLTCGKTRRSCLNKTT